MEPEKSHNQQSGSWKPRKAKGVANRQRADRVDFSLSLKVLEPGASRKEIKVLADELRQRVSEFSCPPLSAQHEPSLVWIMLTHTVEGSLFTNFPSLSDDLFWKHPYNHSYK
jgi:hypothetical protein